MTPRLSNRNVSSTDPSCSVLNRLARRGRLLALAGVVFGASAAAPAAELSAGGEAPRLASRVSDTETPEKASPSADKPESTDDKPKPPTAAVAAATDDVAQKYAARSETQPAQFHGVVPGTSTKEELIGTWGDPARVAEAAGDTAGGEVLKYDLEPFESVEVLVEEGTVSVVRVTLSEDTTVAELASRLKLTQIEPVDIHNPQNNELLAVAYPEKGLTLLVEPTSAGAPMFQDAGVSHLVLEPVDSGLFVLRAERRPIYRLRGKLADLARAIELDPTDAHARWLSAVAHLHAGHAAEAEAAAKKAAELAPADAAYRVTLAEALLESGDFDSAVLENRRALDDDSAPEVTRAEALSLMGRLAAMGDGKLAAKATGFHNAAIEIADRLATTADDTQRRRAKRVLVSSHLAIAKQVAAGDYANKAETVAQWIGRASGFAEELIESDDGGLELRMQVANGALAALSELRPTKDPAPWLAEAKEAADTLLAEHDDPLYRARIHWLLGEMHQKAVRIEHLRGDAQQALSYGSDAIRELVAGAEPRTTSPAAERLVGQLYFYLGAVNAVHKQDHEEAVSWYDKGREILSAGLPDSEFVVPRREGEELVSMGVSYWSQDQRDLAIELTETGARWMERGVEAGVLGEKALAVPYGNLETMYGALDNASKKAEYARLARGVRPQPIATAKSERPAAKPAQQKTATARSKPPAEPQRQASRSDEEKQPAPRGRLSRRRPSVWQTLTR